MNDTHTPGATAPAAEDKSLQLARFWVGLAQLRELVNNTLLPLGHHLGIPTQDDELMDALEAAGEGADAHLRSYRLTAELRAEAGDKVSS